MQTHHDVLESDEVAADIHRWRRFVDRKFRWLTRSATAFLAALLIIHVIYPGLLDWLSDHVGFERPSLVAIVALMVLVSVLEHVVAIEQALKRPSVIIRGTRTQAYRELSPLLEERRATQVDLIQFSGQRAIAFLRDLAERRPQTHIRILLMDPATSAEFDGDDKPNHRERISTTVRELELLAADYRSDGITVEWRYYSVPPSISAILVDDWLVCISWYYCYRNGQARGIVRLRGHLAPAITATDEQATRFLAFARRQFDSLWNGGLPEDGSEGAS